MNLIHKILKNGFRLTTTCQAKRAFQYKFAWITSQRARPSLNTPKSTAFSSLRPTSLLTQLLLRYVCNFELLNFSFEFFFYFDTIARFRMESIVRVDLRLKIGQSCPRRSPTLATTHSRSTMLLITNSTAPIIRQQ